jgi:hypothetical protein
MYCKSGESEEEGESVQLARGNYTRGNSQEAIGKYLGQCLIPNKCSSGEV